MQTAELLVIGLIPIWHCRADISICGITMPTTIGRHRGSQLESRWIPIKAPVGMVLPIPWFQRNIAVFVPMWLIMCRMGQRMKFGGQSSPTTATARETCLHLALWNLPTKTTTNRIKSTCNILCSSLGQRLNRIRWCSTSANTAKRMQPAASLVWLVHRLPHITAA